MKALLKGLAWTIGVVVVLVVATAVVLPIVVDPNDYRDDIAREVEKETGRELKIIGDMRLSVFPWLGVDIGEVELGNAPGFEDPIFASVRKVDVRVKLVPLLRREVEMDTVALHGLSINLARNAEGTGNWEDLLERGAEDPAPAAGQGEPGHEGSLETPIAALFVGGLDVREASLGWVDEASGQRFRVSNLRLRTGALAASEPVDLEFYLDVEGARPALSGRLEGRAKVAADPVSGDLRVAGLALNGDFEGERLPGGKASLEASVARVEVTGGGQSVLVQDLLVDGLGLVLTGHANARGPWERPTVTGEIETNEFSPRDLLEALGQAAPDTADPRALQRAALKATVGGTGGGVELRPMTLALDDSTLEGHLAIVDFSGPAMRFDLALDAIDVDRYLAPAPSGEGNGRTGGAVTPGSAATTAGAVPTDILRDLDIDGRLGLGKLKLSGLTITDIVAGIKAKDGLVRLHPVSAQLYQGQYDGNITVDARKDPIQMHVDEKLTGIQAGPLLEDLVGKDHLTGTADVHATVRARGTTPDAIKRTMKGQVRFAFTNGALKGINVARSIREVKAAIGGKRLEPGHEELETDFSELGGTVRLGGDAVARNDDLTAKSPLLRIDGKGKADLLKETIKYRLTATVVGSIEGQGGRGLDELRGIPIPILVRGTFQNPEFGLDEEALVRALAKSQADELVEKHLGGRGGKKIKKKDLEKEADKLLKGILGN